MHFSANGREPLRGMTFERPTPALELSKTQLRGLQAWAIGFYNAAGALTSYVPCPPARLILRSSI